MSYVALSCEMGNGRLLDVDCGRRLYWGLAFGVTAPLLIEASSGDVLAFVMGIRTFLVPISIGVIALWI